MEHRGGLQHHGAHDEEDDRGEMQHLPARPEQPDEHEQKEDSADRRDRVCQLSDPFGVVEPQPVAELDPDAADGEEAGRRVVAPGPLREAAVSNEERGVVDRLVGVVPGDGRVDRGVPDGDDGGDRDHAPRRNASGVSA